jgi:hypothetical protein
MFGLEKDFSNNIEQVQADLVFTWELRFKARGVLEVLFKCRRFFRYAGLKSCPHWDTMRFIVKFIGVFLRSIQSVEC